MTASPVPDWLLEQGKPLTHRGDHPLRDLIADLLDELEEDDRRVLEMWAWEGLTFQAIANELGLAGRQGGHYRVVAALAKLKVLLKEKGIGYDN
jgi:DNA-directed RNA polymerase specialized sigma24 family protein